MRIKEGWRAKEGGRAKASSGENCGSQLSDLADISPKGN